MRIFAKEKETLVGSVWAPLPKSKNIFACGAPFTGEDGHAQILRNVEKERGGREGGRRCEASLFEAQYSDNHVQKALSPCVSIVIDVMQRRHLK